MISDVEEFDCLRVVGREIEKGVGARGDNPLAEFYGNRDGAGRLSPDFHIGEHDVIAQRHAREKIVVVEDAHKVDPACHGV